MIGYTGISTSHNKTKRYYAVERYFSAPTDVPKQVSLSDFDGLTQQNSLNQTFPSSPTKRRSTAKMPSRKKSIFDNQSHRFNRVSASGDASLSVRTSADTPSSPTQSNRIRQSSMQGSAPSAFNPPNKIFNRFKSTVTTSVPNSPKWTSVRGNSPGVFGHVSSQRSERRYSSASLTRSDSSPALMRLKSTPNHTPQNQIPRKAGSRIQTAIAFEGNLRETSVDSDQISGKEKLTQALTVSIPQDDGKGMFEKVARNGISTNLEMSCPSISSPRRSSLSISSSSPSISSPNTSSPNTFSPNTSSPNTFSPNTSSPKTSSPKAYSPKVGLGRPGSFKFIGTVRKASLVGDPTIVYTSLNISEGPKEAASPVKVKEEKAVLAGHDTEHLELIIPEELVKVPPKEQKIKEVLDKMKPGNKDQSRAQQLWKKSAEKKKELLKKQKMEREFVVIERGRKFPMKDLMRLKGYFEEIDLDGNGTIDRDELEAQIQKSLQGNEDGEGKDGVKMMLNTLHENMTLEEFLAVNIPILSKKDIRMCVEALPKRPRVVNDTLKGEIEDVLEHWKVYSDPDGYMSFKSFEYLLHRLAESSNDSDEDFKLFQLVRNTERAIRLKDFTLWRLNMIDTREPLEWEDIEEKIEEIQSGLDIWGNVTSEVEEAPEPLFTKTSKFSRIWKRIS